MKAVSHSAPGNHEPAFLPQELLPQGKALQKALERGLGFSSVVQSKRKFLSLILGTKGAREKAPEVDAGRRDPRRSRGRG